MTTSFDRFVGIDWSKEKHDLCIIDSDGKKLFQSTVEHSISGLQQLISFISQFSENNFDRVAVAIEVSHGPIVDLLIERGISVYSINPKQLDRFRDRHSLAGAKDDRLDSFVLANSLKTDINCFHRIKIKDPLIMELREISRISDELAKEKVRIINRIEEQIYRFFPHFFEICSDITNEWVFELLKIIISDRKIQRNQITKLLKKYHVRKVTTDKVINVINTPFLTLAGGTINGIIFHLEILVDEIQLLQNKIKKCRKKLEELLKQIESNEKKDFKYSDVEIIRSMPGIGDIVTSILITESSELLFARNYEGLRAISGIAPVTKRSGKKMIVRMRHSCNKRLRNAMHYWADNSMKKDEKSKNFYKELRQRGHKHSRALRGLGDRLLRILTSMLRSNTLYDPEYKIKNLTSGNNLKIAT